MRPYIEIGPSPCNENCVQVGDDNYATAAREECLRFIQLIRNTLGPEPVGAELKVKGFPHDFGTYYEVVCYYNEDDEVSTQYAFNCESGAPDTW